MSDAHEPYPVEPTPESAPTPAPPPPPPAEAPGAAPKPRIEAPKLLDDFEEDADFTADPEVDMAVGRAPKRAMAAAPEAPAVPEFVKPGFGEPKHWAIAGGVLLVAAMIAAGVNAPYGAGAGQVTLRIVLTVYDSLLSTGTGVVAAFIAARLLEERFGSVELAAGRMFAAVNAFLFIYNLSIRLTGVSFIDEIVVLILAAAAYGLIVAWTFKLWSMVPLAYVAGSHVLLWLVILLGMTLSQMVKPGLPRPEGIATPVRVHPAPAPATGGGPSGTPVR